MEYIALLLAGIAGYLAGRHGRRAEQKAGEAIREAFTNKRIRILKKTIPISLEEKTISILDNERKANG